MHRRIRRSGLLREDELRDDELRDDDLLDAEAEGQLPLGQPDSTGHLPPGQGDAASAVTGGAGALDGTSLLARANIMQNKTGIGDSPLVKSDQTD